jgi:hypothetical protein
MMSGKLFRRRLNVSSLLKNCLRRRREWRKRRSEWKKIVYGRMAI